MRVTSDRWVLSTVQGYQLEFLEEPFQWHKPHPPQFNQEHAQIIETEVSQLVENGVVVKVRHHPEEGFHPTVFLVLKKEGGQRPVINLKELNKFIRTQHFKMEGIHTLRDLLQPGDWLMKVDLKDAYFTIPIHSDHRKYLRFLAQRKVYQFTFLPFGLSSAPWVFTKTLKPIAALMRELWLQVVFYIDNILLMAETKDLAHDQMSLLTYLLESLGFTLNEKKVILEPTQRLEFVGLTVAIQS